MENLIEEKVMNSLKIAENKFKKDENVQQFEKAKKSFKELVEKGYIKERGNNLLSISDFGNARVIFNIK
jgi:coproporphyrinogen III oxidase-like Fe-S oxidoreductase